MTLVDGRFVPDTEEVILDVLLARAAEIWGVEEFGSQSRMRKFYEPVATLLAEAQQDAALILDSAQLEYAEGIALDLLTALIGVPRQPAVKATTTLTFSRATPAAVDYIIPAGTKVQTDALSPVRFVTTEKATLAAASTSIAGVPAEAVVGGQAGNVGPDRLTVMPDPPVGVESVTNPSEASGGVDAEPDDDLRERAKRELSTGSRATAQAVRNYLLNVPDVQDVSLFINDQATTDGDGRPAHSTEYVVLGGADADIGQALVEAKAAADGTTGGHAGTLVSSSGVLDNGQSFPVSFSRPTALTIYVDAALSVSDTYEGDTKVRDAIVQYVGGTLTSGDFVPGELGIGDDVLYTRLVAAIMSVEGVENITSLTFDTVDPPVGTTDITVAASEVAVTVADATTIDITTA